MPNTKPPFTPLRTEILTGPVSLANESVHGIIRENVRRAFEQARQLGFPQESANTQEIIEAHVRHARGIDVLGFLCVKYCKIPDGYLSQRHETLITFGGLRQSLHSFGNQLEYEPVVGHSDINSLAREGLLSDAVEALRRVAMCGAEMLITAEQQRMGELVLYQNLVRAGRAGGFAVRDLYRDAHEPPVVMEEVNPLGPWLLDSKPVFSEPHHRSVTLNVLAR
jgi:hypothetical protein